MSCPGEMGGTQRAGMLAAGRSEGEPPQPVQGGEPG